MISSDDDLPALARLDALIGCFRRCTDDFVHSSLVPAILAGEVSEFLPSERRWVDELREALTSEEWTDLSGLIARRRAGEHVSLSLDVEFARRRLEAQQAEDHRRKRAAEAEAEKSARRAALIDRIRREMVVDFLNARDVYDAHPDYGLVSDAEFDDLAAEFVHGWASRQLNLDLDPEQAAAVAEVHGDVQVIARAGSGKTRTLVTRALFLLLHCRVSPGEIMILAFNRRAVEDIRTRIRDRTDGPLPHVLTFHALAHALVQPSETLVYDDRDSDQMGLSRSVQRVIDDHVRSTRWGRSIRELMLSYFKEDWERLVRGGFHLEPEKLLAYRRALPSESLNGEWVKSFGERLIANTLFEHGIPYAYEASFPWSGVNYRPDFKVERRRGSGIIIEYFGLKGRPDYDEMSARKREFWSARPDYELIEVTPSDIGDGDADAFARLLMARLAKVGLHAQRLDDEEIWRRIKDRAIDRFTEVVTLFVGRCTKLGLTDRDLMGVIERHTPISTAETGFLAVVPSIYRAYQDALVAADEEDFAGLVWKAADAVDSGRATTFVRDQGKERGDIRRLRFVMIDEFQDFSKMFLALTKAMQSVSGHARVFCVGDDWQAINRFAGSDLRYFHEFDRYFGKPTTRHLTTNYRSKSEIVAASNALMHGSGKPGRAHASSPGSVAVYSVDDLTLSPGEAGRHNGNAPTAAVLRIITTLLDQGLEVVLLSRRNAIPRGLQPTIRGVRTLNDYLEHVRSFLPERHRASVTISTTHRYKGLESGAVVILDAVPTAYPLVHPSWFFQRVLGESVPRIEADERRLFYVALTRAEDALVLLANASGTTPYVDDIAMRVELRTLDLDDLPPAPGVDGVSWVEIRVEDGREVKAELQADGYAYSGGYWSKPVPEADLSIDALRRRGWARAGYGIKVINESGRTVHELP